MSSSSAKSKFSLVNWNSRAQKVPLKCDSTNLQSHGKVFRALFMQIYDFWISIQNALEMSVVLFWNLVTEEFVEPHCHPNWEVDFLPLMEVFCRSEKSVFPGWNEWEKRYLRSSRSTRSYLARQEILFSVIKISSMSKYEALWSSTIPKSDILAQAFLNLKFLICEEDTIYSSSEILVAARLCG